MASADEYAAWIVANQDKKGSDDFNTVAKAYEDAKAEEAQQAKVGSEGAPNEGFGTPPSFMGGLALGAGQVPITLASMIPGAPTREEMAATLEQRVRDIFPGEPSQLGKIPAEAISTLPVGAGLGAAAKAVPFLRGLAPALETGGFARDLSLLQRATGGAATGGVAGGLLGGKEEMGVGAGTGALLSAVAPPVVSGAARIAGRMFEPETSAALKAAEIARQAASAEGRMPAVEAALRQAGDEFTGRQAVEPAFSPTLQALGAAAEAARHAVLEPGDALFIPSLWWHHVRATASLSMLVNYWWDVGPPGAPSPFDAMVLSLAALRGLPAERRRAWRAFYDHYVFEADEETHAHLPANRRGVLGPLTPATLDRIRRFIVAALSRG